MRRSAALVLTAPTFAEIVCASTLFYPNVLGAFLLPLMLLAFVFLIVGLAIASKNHESTSRSTWALLAVAGVVQIATLIRLGAFAFLMFLAVIFLAGVAVGGVFTYWAMRLGEARMWCRVAGMALFRTDSVVLCYSNVEAAQRWWIDAFDCKQVNVPPDWDNPLPSDVALKLPGYSEPTILLNDRAEVQQAGFDRSASVVPIIFSDKLKKAHEHLSSRGIIAGPIQGDGECQFFEVRDIEGNVIEICKEP